MPHSLMIGCYAEAKSRDIHRDEAELEDCRWFTREETIEMLEQPVAELASKVGAGSDYVILPRQTWEEIEKVRPGLPPPILSSRGKGPEGDAPLVLVRAQVT